MLNGLRGFLQTAHDIPDDIVGRLYCQNVDCRYWEVDFRTPETVVFFIELVILNGEPSFHEGIVDDLISAQALDRYLPELLQRFLDKCLFFAVDLVAIIVQQVIVAFDPVVNGLGWMKLKVFFEEIRAEFGKGGHCALVPDGGKQVARFRMVRNIALIFGVLEKLLKDNLVLRR